MKDYTMALWKIIAFTCIIFQSAESKVHHSNEKISPGFDDSSICAPAFNSTSEIQCFCSKDSRDVVRSAECYIVNENISQDDPNWAKFSYLKKATKLSFTNTRNISFKYIPKHALQYTKNLVKVEFKYGNIKTIDSYAFANLSLLEEIELSGNQIEKMKAFAFAHHDTLDKISLDSNNIVEINRDVFIDLPGLEKLFITNNKVAIIHDKAFIHLSNLKELEIDRNKLFSLNSETFSGLTKLMKLDLSGNSLEVIGDNTFKPLTNLISLNLDDNKIQMLDSNAFHGLVKLQLLSLAHNELRDIDNENVFKGLVSVTSLSLKGNRIRELQQEVMAPILSNFYLNSAALDVEDNDFPCDCRLEWFMELMNKTESAPLKLMLENFKCLPDALLRDRWMKKIEAEKINNLKVFEGDEPPAQNQDYDYYDETELNGKLFYTDIREYLNCTAYLKANNKPSKQGIVKPTTPPTTTTTMEIDNRNAGYFDESIFNTTKAPEADKNSNGHEVANQEERKEEEGNIEKNDKDNIYTTTRLATVSAKPLEEKTADTQDAMASDEAKSFTVVAHRSVQEKDEDYNDLFGSADSYFQGSFKTVVFVTVLNVRFLFY
ncbi:connectin-like [Battus philenor]|uniref:connectin-like n=1 Tax=Battus philenor TaxID=42288 RepID=UPI0035CF3D8F